MMLPAAWLLECEADHNIARTTPPSTRSAAPVVAEDNSPAK